METSESVICGLIDKLKDAVSDLRSTDAKVENDFFLYHWLRSHSMDVNKAETAIRANIKWREAKNIEELETEDLDPTIAKSLPFFFDAKRQDGGLLLYIQAAKLNVPSLWENHGKDRLFRHITHCLVKMEQLVLKKFNRMGSDIVRVLKGEDNPQFFGIYDAEGFTLRHATSMKNLQVYLECAKLGACYFPAVGTTGAIINANKFVEIAFRLIRPLLESRGVCVSVYTMGEQVWGEHVFRHVESDELHSLQTRAKMMAMSSA